jgi:hypothetical protein
MQLGRLLGKNLLKVFIKPLEGVPDAFTSVKELPVLKSGQVKELTRRQPGAWPGYSWLGWPLHWRFDVPKDVGTGIVPQPDEFRLSRPKSHQRERVPTDSSMRIQRNPESVMISDAQALPVAWKDVVITMPAYAWEALLQRLDGEDRALFEKQVKKTEFKPDKRSIASELKKGLEIPGADLKFGDLCLRID